MSKVMNIEDAVSLVKDGDSIWVNAFLAIANPAELNSALSKRVRDTGSPHNLTVYCSAGFGDYKEGSECEGYIVNGAVRKVVLGHLSTMPDTCKKIRANEIEAYNLPLGVMSHMIRGAASGETTLRSRIGVNLYVDPRHNKYGLNDLSTEQMVHLSSENGEEVLLYDIPKIDVALIKGSSADFKGNISFEDDVRDD